MEEEIQNPEVPAEVPEAPEVDAAMVQAHWDGVDRIYDGFLSEAEQVKALYPEFDLAAEVQRPTFARMLRAGVPISKAYQAEHCHEILPAAMEYAAKMTQQRLAGSMGSGLNRPAENGLRGGGAIRVGSNPGNMSRADYNRICRMVERGAKVSLG